MAIATETIEMTPSVPSSSDNKNDTMLRDDDLINLKPLDIERKGTVENDDGHLTTEGELSQYL